MPRYRIEALEQFVVRTVYLVPARSRQHAEKLCRLGRVAYDEQQIEEGDEKWIETVWITEQGTTERRITRPPCKTPKRKRRPRA